VKTWNTTHT